jgi:hypothetical protein
MGRGGRRHRVPPELTAVHALAADADDQKTALDADGIDDRGVAVEPDDHGLRRSCGGLNEWL